MYLLLLIPVAIMLLTLPSNSVAQQKVDPCRLFPNGTKLRDPDDCSQGITCIDFTAVYGTKKCSGSTPFYDKDKDACAKDLTDNTVCDIDCTESSGKFVSDYKSCFGYFYCQDEELALYGQCPVSTHFNETQQSCIHISESNCTVAALDFCAIVKDGVNFKDESNCANYFVCKKGVLAKADCTKTQGYYDAVSGKCIQKSLVDCPQHPLPKNVCGTAKLPKKSKFVSDDATCRGYFYCADVKEGPDPNPRWLQCPENTFFNLAKQTCDDPLNVACSQDRCDGRTLTLVSSGVKGCRNYLRCENDATVEQLSCGNRFFDEEQTVCTSNIITYPSCS